MPKDAKLLSSLVEAKVRLLVEAKDFHLHGERLALLLLGRGGREIFPAKTQACPLRYPDKALG